MTLAKHEDFIGASEKLDAASRLWPSADSFLVSHGELVRQVLEKVPKNKTKSRKILFASAKRYLEKAAQRNPLRPETPTILGLLYFQNPDLTGADWQQKASQSFRHALALNPRVIDARTAYARLLAAEGEKKEAARVLAAGLPYDRPRSPKLISYYDLTANFEAETGNPKGAKALRKKVEERATTLNMAHSLLFGLFYGGHH